MQIATTQVVFSSAPYVQEDPEAEHTRASHFAADLYAKRKMIADARALYKSSTEGRKVWT